MFENIEDAKRQLRRDKHTLLEGYVTEHCYEMQFLRDNDSIAGYTNGWWAAAKGTRWFFFLVKEDMNDVDRKVFDLLSQWYECWHVYPAGDEWRFSNGTEECDEAAFLQKYSLSRFGANGNAADDVRDVPRQNRCIEFFEEKGILRQIAIERHFADDFLNGHFSSMSNIDFIKQEADGSLCIVEVKFKFESQSGSFGINIGQASLFELLEQRGFSIYHYILYNHTKNSAVTVLDFLALDAPRNWLHGQLTDFANRRVRVAPRRTSVYGRRQQEFCSFSMDEISGRTPLVLR